MIERKIVAKNVREYLVHEYISKELPKASCSKIELKKTPLGEKIIVHTSRPGLVVGKKGVNIQRLNEILKNKFEIENPQVEIAEIENPNLDPKSVAERIVSSFERFGPKRFKSIGIKVNILTPDVKLPDDVKLKEDVKIKAEPEKDETKQIKKAKKKTTIEKEKTENDG